MCEVAARRLVTILVGVVALGLPRAGTADECQMKDTLNTCWARLHLTSEKVLAAVDQAAEENRQAEAERLREIPTGQDTSGTNLETTTKDLLPMLALSGLFGGSSSNDADGTVTIDLNFLFGGATARNTQLQAVLPSEPRVAEGLVQAIPEDQREAAVAALEEGLDAADDLTLALTYSPTGRKLGRSFGQYRGWYEVLVWGARQRVGKDFAALSTAGTVADAFIGLNEIAQTCPGIDGENLQNVPFATIGLRCGSEAGVAAKAAVESVAIVAWESVNRAREAVTDAGLDRFANLVNNQPQFYFSGVYRDRDPRVGGDEATIRATYEHGFANLNAALKGCDLTLADAEVGSLDGDSVERCLDQFGRWVQSREPDLEAGARMSFSLEWVDIKSATIDLAQFKIPGLESFIHPASQKLIVSAGISRFVTVGTAGIRARTDIVARYEEVSNDPLRQSRFVASATLTVPVGPVTVPIGLVYANRGEYLTDVDERLGVHVGLRFRAFGPGEE